MVRKISVELELPHQVVDILEGEAKEYDLTVDDIVALACTQYYFWVERQRDEE